MSWTPPFHVFQPAADNRQSNAQDRPTKDASARTLSAASMTPAGVPFEVTTPTPAQPTRAQPAPAQPTPAQPTPAKKVNKTRKTTLKRTPKQQTDNDVQLAQAASETDSPTLGVPFTPNPAPTITLPVTLGALELSFADGQSQPVSSSEDLPEGPLNHHQAATAIGISPALLACYVSIFRSLGGRLEYSAEDLRTNKHALQPRYDKTLIEGFRDVRAQVRAGADIRTAMAVVTTSRLENAGASTSKSNSKSKAKSKRSTAKLEALTSVNASLSKEIAALQAELDDLKGGRSKPFSA